MVWKTVMAWKTVRKCYRAFSHCCPSHDSFNEHDEKVTIEIGLFCLQPLMNSQFYLLSWNWHPHKWLIIFQNQVSHTCCSHVDLSCAGPTDTSSSSWMSIWPFLNTLHHFLTCCTPIIPPSYISINFHEFQCRKHVPSIQAESHHELWGTEFTMSLPQHIKLPPAQYVTVSCAICFTLPVPYMLH